MSLGYVLIAIYYIWTNFFYLSKRIEKVLAERKVLRFSESITLLRKWDLYHWSSVVWTKFVGIVSWCAYPGVVRPKEAGGGSEDSSVLSCGGWVPRGSGEVVSSPSALNPSASRSVELKLYFPMHACLTVGGRSLSLGCQKSEP